MNPIVRLPSEEELRTALAANRSMKDGEVVWDNGMCACDPEVGMSPCEYCAIHTALTKTLAFLPELGRWSAELSRLRAIVERLPKTADGVPVTPGMELFTIVPPGEVMPVRTYRGYAISQMQDQHEIGFCYSTEAAALAAKGAQ